MESTQESISKTKNTIQNEKFTEEEEKLLSFKIK